MNARHVPALSITTIAHDTSDAYLFARHATASRTASDFFKLKSGATVKTISHDPGKISRCRRKISLTIRLIRLRRTVPRMSLCTLIPRRLCERSFARKISENPFPFSRLPFLYTRKNSCGFRRRLSLGSANPFTSLRGQSLTSFCPSAFDHCLSGSGAHPRPESVGTFSLNITWLKCSFTHGLRSFCSLTSHAVRTTIAS